MKNKLNEILGVYCRSLEDIKNTIDSKKISVDKTMFVNSTFERESADDKNRTINISFASEEPYLRWFGWEIIDIASMDLSRLNNKAMLLYNHDWDKYIGVIEKAWVVGSKAYATVRFDTHEQAEQIFQSVKAGIISQVSFGYEILNAWQVPSTDENEAFRVTVKGFEVSFVTVAADPSVGYGRMKDKEIEKKDICITIHVEDEEKEEMCEEICITQEPMQTEDFIVNTVDFKETTQEENQENKNIDEKLAIEIKNVDNKNKVDEIQQKQLNININMEKNKMDRLEVNAKIAELAKQYNEKDLGFEFMSKSGDITVEMFKDALLEKRASSAVMKDTIHKEIDNSGFSMGLALKQLMNGEISGSVREMNQEMERRYGEKRGENSILLPLNMLQRDVTVGTAGSAGNLKPSVLSNTFIESLYNDLVIVKAGATYMSDLVGDLKVPRFNNVISAQYVGENAAATGSSQEVDLVTLSGKDLTANIDVSRSIRLQTPYNIEALVTNEMNLAIRHKMDLDALIGTGASNSVKGVLNQTGIGSVTTGGTVSWQDVLDLEAAVKAKNALVNKGCYITTSKIESLLKGTQKGSGVGFIMENGQANNYNVFTTNGLPEVAGTPKTSSLLFGDFSQLMIGTWGSIEIMYDPYTSSKTGKVSFTIFITWDAAVRHPSSFAVASDIAVV